MTSAALGCLFGEDWTSPRLVELQISPDGHMVGHCEAQADFSAFVGASEDLVHNLHRLAPVDGLDGEGVR
jgi:hypothetical protein